MFLRYSSEQALCVVNPTWPMFQPVIWHQSGKQLRFNQSVVTNTSRQDLGLSLVRCILINKKMTLTIVINDGEAWTEQILCAECVIRLCLWLASRDSLLVRAPDSWSKGCEFESQQERRIFFSGVNITCWLLFGVRSTPVLPKCHVKDHSHLPKVQWHVTPKHACTLDPFKSEWADYAAVQV